jgi:MFS family permease
MVTLFQLMINTGALLAAITNAGLQSMSAKVVFDAPWMQTLFVDEVWRGMFLMEAVPAMLFFLLCLLVPLSPRWLVKEKRLKDAEAVLRRLRNPATVPAELSEISEAVAHEQSSFAQLFAKGLRTPIFIGLFLAVIGDLSGITAVFYYGPGIFERAGFERNAAMTSFVMISSFLLVGTALASWLVDRVGRKPFLYVSTTGCILTLLGTGVLLKLGAGYETKLVWLICGFALFFAIGLGPIKFVIITEMFPTRLRGRASAVCTQGLWIAVSLVISIFPIMRDGLGMAACFFAFGAVLFLVYPFMFWVLPETKGRSLEVLEKMWVGST